MKISFVSEHASPLAVIGGVDTGGQNVHVAALASHLAAAGHHVTVHTRRSDTASARRVRFTDGVVVDHVPAGPPHDIGKDEMWRHMPAFADDLRRQWAMNPPDVIHAHFWMSGWAALAARPPTTPVVQTFHALGVVKRRHQGSADTSPPDRICVERDLCRRVDRIVATCRDEVAELIRLGADPAIIDVVPCGVDLACFRPDDPPAETQAMTGGVTRRHRVLMVGRLVPRKGWLDSLRALATVPDTELLIAGGPDIEDLADDADARALRAAAADAGVTDRVRMLGRVARPDMPDLIRSVDIVLCPPWYEPFGIVPLEAMACGRPVVATAVGGMLDTVRHEVTGLLVPPRDPVALAAALRRLLDHADVRRRMGEAGRIRAVRHYGWGHIAKATMSAYETVVTTRTPAVAADRRATVAHARMNVGVRR